MTVVVEISLIPIGEGTSLSKYVADAQKVLQRLGVEHLLTPSSTVFQASSRKEALEIIDMLCEEVFKKGAKRLVTTIKIDERRDKPGWGMKYKLESVKEKLS